MQITLVKTICQPSCISSVAIYPGYKFRYLALSTNDKEIIFGDDFSSTNSMLMYEVRSPPIKRKWMHLRPRYQVRPGLCREIETCRRILLPTCFPKTNQDLSCQRIVRNTGSSYSMVGYITPRRKRFVPLSSAVS